MDIAKLWVVNRTGTGRPQATKMLPQAGRSLTTCATVPRPPAPALHASAALTFGRAGSASGAARAGRSGAVQCGAVQTTLFIPARRVRATAPPRPIEPRSRVRGTGRAGRTRFRLPVYYSALHGASARLIRVAGAARGTSGSAATNLFITETGQFRCARGWGLSARRRVLNTSPAGIVIIKTPTADAAAASRAAGRRSGPVLLAARMIDFQLSSRSCEGGCDD